MSRTEASIATQKSEVVFNVGGMFSAAGTLSSEAQVRTTMSFQI